MGRTKSRDFIDLFCGAGGFSEGLRLAGFEPVLGVDNWKCAVETYKNNFDSDAVQMDILELASTTESIENLPDTVLIVGSPPCVSFSNSNKSGYADKSLGVELTNAFLKIVALKKNKPDSLLRAWVMENVEKSLPYLQETYTYNDLGLGAWATSNGYKRKDIALDLKGKKMLINAADFMAPQNRKRLFVGELDGGAIPISTPKQSAPKTLGEIFKGISKPGLKRIAGKVEDPNYPELVISKKDLTDHFYDTGIPSRFWKESKYLKTNHPYMGKMSFPERLDKPARTVVASPFSRSRESMIFNCKSNRKGNGEYRSPTIREAAILMTFPINYQFYGTEGQKWRLVGNAVCPIAAKAIGFEIKKKIKFRKSLEDFASTRKPLANFNNLNSCKAKEFKNIPKRRSGARFRRHPFKHGNMTIALANYDMGNNLAADNSWRVYATYGISTVHKINKLNSNCLEDIEQYLYSIEDKKLVNFLGRLDNFIEKVTPRDAGKLQRSYELARDYHCKSNPVTILEAIKDKIEKNVNGEFVDRRDLPFFAKEAIPLKQVVAAYALLKTVELQRGHDD